MRTILFLAVIILSACLVYAQQPDGGMTESGGLKAYSLEELFMIALERAEAIKLSEEDVNIAGRGRDKAFSAFLPVISAFGDYTKYSKKIVNADGFLLQPDNSRDWGLNMDYSLSLGGREFTAYRISKENITRSLFELDAVKEEYLLNVARAYYDVLKAKKALEIASQNVQRLTKHRNAAETRLKVGEATKTVLLRAEAELSGAQSEQIATENIVKLAMAVLARTVGISETFDIKEINAFIESYRREAPAYLTEGCQLPTLHCIKQTAFSERAELRALDMQKKIAEDEVKHAKGLYWPSLKLQGVYTRNENDPSRSFEIDERIFGIVSLDFTLFEGGLRKAEVGEAQAKQNQSELLFEDLKKTVSVDVERAYLDFLTQKGILESLEDQLEFARENYKSVEKQFQYGLADSVDVMDANSLLVTAERELARTGYEYQLAILKLKWATGTLLKTVVKSEGADK